MRSAALGEWIMEVEEQRRVTMTLEQSGNPPGELASLVLTWPAPLHCAHVHQERLRLIGRTTAREYERRGIAATAAAAAFV